MGRISPKKEKTHKWTDRKAHGQTVKGGKEKQASTGIMPTRILALPASSWLRIESNPSTISEPIGEDLALFGVPRGLGCKASLPSPFRAFSSSPPFQFGRLFAGDVEGEEEDEENDTLPTSSWVAGDIDFEDDFGNNSSDLE